MRRTSAATARARQGSGGPGRRPTPRTAPARRAASRARGSARAGRARPSTTRSPPARRTAARGGAAARDRLPASRRSRPQPSVRPVTRYVGRDNVRKRLEPLSAEPGRTIYADGEARIETATETFTVRPPFGMAHEGVYNRVELGPLFE